MRKSFFGSEKVFEILKCYEDNVDAWDATEAFDTMGESVIRPYKTRKILRGRGRQSTKVKLHMYETRLRSKGA